MVAWPGLNQQNPLGKGPPLLLELASHGGHLWATLEGETDSGCERDSGLEARLDPWLSWAQIVFALHLSVASAMGAICLSERETHQRTDLGLQPEHLDRCKSGTRPGCCPWQCRGLGVGGRVQVGGVEGSLAPCSRVPAEEGRRAVCPSRWESRCSSPD